jgi:hypothetical protein
MSATKSVKTVAFTGYMADTKVSLMMSGKTVERIGIARDRASDGKKFRVNFQVGDAAVYDSYNLIYTGTIKSITEKTVTITKKYSNQTTRLPLDRFAMRNYDFDAQRIADANAETMMYI